MSALQLLGTLLKIKLGSSLSVQCSEFSPTGALLDNM